MDLPITLLIYVAKNLKIRKALAPRRQKLLSMAKPMDMQISLYKEQVITIFVQETVVFKRSWKK